MNIKNKLFLMLFIALFSSSLTICQAPYGKNKLALEKTILTALTVSHKTIEKSVPSTTQVFCCLGVLAGTTVGLIMLFSGMEIAETFSLMDKSREINNLWWLLPIAGGGIGGSMTLEHIKKTKENQ